MLIWEDATWESNILLLDAIWMIIWENATWKSITLLLDATITDFDYALKFNTKNLEATRKSNTIDNAISLDTSWDLMTKDATSRFLFDTSDNLPKDSTIEIIHH